MIKSLKRSVRKNNSLRKDKQNHRKLNSIKKKKNMSHNKIRGGSGAKQPNYLIYRSDEGKWKAANDDQLSCWDPEESKSCFEYKNIYITPENYLYEYIEEDGDKYIKADNTKKTDITQGEDGVLTYIPSQHKATKSARGKTTEHTTPPPQIPVKERSSYQSGKPIMTYYIQAQEDQLPWCIATH